MSKNKVMKFIVIEDEVPAKEKLFSFIQSYYNNMVEISWARSNKQAIEILSKRSFDLIFADIKILDGLSFDTFETIPTSTPIIFCTAYDEFLLKAFESNGIAYLIKPYSLQSLENALKKFELLFDKKDKEINYATLDRLKKLIQSE
ncbi:response regulator [Flavobacteriaceae bacterium Ap0902]|nr:response regulator [Flavobacteriaceae bacterium Ap0902]